MAWPPTSSWSGNAANLMHDQVTSELARPVGRVEVIAVPKPYPEEFRQGVMWVARNRGPGCDGGAGGHRLRGPSDDVVEMDAPGGYRRRDQARGAQPGERGTAGNTSADQAAGAGERGPTPGRPICRRRICREKDLPARERAGRGRGARHGDVPGAQARQTALLPLAGQAGCRRRAGGGISRERTVRRPPRRPRVRLPFPGR